MHPHSCETNEPPRAEIVQSPATSARLRKSQYFYTALMNDTPPREQREHELTLQVFAISAGMVGVCLTAIGILRLITAQTQVQTLGDEFLAADSILFVVCCFLSFWSFKTRASHLRRVLRIVIDVLFMIALVIMAGVCVIIAYALM